MSTTRIEDGVEWYTWTREDGTEETDCQCARCGSSCVSTDCYGCGGEGGYFGEVIAGYYDFGWIDPDCWYTCRACRGKGGWWICGSGSEWCESNPLPGREHIESTARGPHD